MAEENPMMQVDVGEKGHIRITVVTQGIVWLAVIGNIQLALSHPKNKGVTADLVREFAEQVLNKLEQEGVISHEVSEKCFGGFI